MNKTEVSLLTRAELVGWSLDIESRLGNVEDAQQREKLRTAMRLSRKLLDLEARDPPLDYEEWTNSINEYFDALVSAMPEAAALLNRLRDRAIASPGSKGAQHENCCPPRNCKKSNPRHPR